MPSEIQVNGSACPLIISEREFRASPLRDVDSTELSEYVQHKIMDFARKSSPSRIERLEAIQGALSICVGLHWMSEEGNKILGTIEGTARLGWQMTRKNHDVSFRDFLDIFHDQEDRFVEDNLESIDLVFAKLNTVKEKKKDNKESNDKKDVVTDEEKN